MADRIIEEIPADVPVFEGILEAVLLQALDEGRAKLESGEELVPFTALAVGETLFIESHPGDNSEECFMAAQHTVQNVRGAAAYAFCYDGYVETDEGELDAIIAEGGVPGSPMGHAIGVLYTVDEDNDYAITIDEQPLYIGQAPNFMEFTTVVEDDEDSDAADEDVDEADEDGDTADKDDDAGKDDGDTDEDDGTETERD